MKPPRTCQLLDLLWQNDPIFARWLIAAGGYGWAKNQPVDHHHLFGGTSRKNRAANLLEISHPIHMWGHGFPVRFRVACLYRQRQLGKLDWSVLDECFGGRPGRVKGLIESKVLTGVYEKWRMELLDG